VTIYGVAASRRDRLKRHANPMGCERYLHPGLAEFHLRSYYLIAQSVARRVPYPWGRSPIRDCDRNARFIDAATRLRWNRGDVSTFQSNAG